MPPACGANRYLRLRNRPSASPRSAGQARYWSAEGRHPQCRSRFQHKFLAIGPDECTDSAEFIPECPGSAIVAEQDLQPDPQHRLAINAELAKVFPAITEELDPLPDADKSRSR
jgi:hypothetical protein